MKQVAIQWVKVRDKVMSYITLFHSGHGYYGIISAYRGHIHIPWILSVFHVNINVLWIISVFCGYICTLWILSAFRGYIHVPWILSAFRGYYPHFVNTISISHITSYLACNVCHVLHIFVLVADIIFGRVTSYLACNVCTISHILPI